MELPARHDLTIALERNAFARKLGGEQLAAVSGASKRRRSPLMVREASVARANFETIPSGCGLPSGGWLLSGMRPSHCVARDQGPHGSAFRAFLCGSALPAGSADGKRSRRVGQADWPLPPLPACVDARSSPGQDRIVSSMRV
jgi:hypothetical protein